MSINNFIPQVWSAQILMNLHKAQIWGQPAVVNTNYQGEIKGQGSSVRINAIGKITISKNTKGTAIGLPAPLQDASTVLPIDQGDFYNFMIDDVDAAQSNANVMTAAMDEAGYAVSDTADQYIAGLVAGASNLIGTVAVPKTDLAPSGGVTKAYDYLVDLGVQLGNSNVTRSGRWAIVPPWYHGLLQKDDRFVKFGTDPQQNVLKNGIVGRAAGFDIYESNNCLVEGSAVYSITAGYPGAISYADQISETIAFRPEQFFADAVKGLHVYGAKLVRPQGIAVLKAQDPGF
jgi:hypothetical protein